jgi:malate dehydrogenase (oxaloacetate-decarboxylating)
MSKKAIALHRKLKGKIYVESKIPKITDKSIQLIYTPGVASVCKEIVRQPELKFSLTGKGNNVAIVTDGTRILGLGNIGPDAALPVMEGKSVLYRKYGKIDAYPICLNTTDKEKIINIVQAIEPVFGAINLEDIESPKVLDISKELEKKLPIPVFHDDRHGTAVVVLAALLNSLKITNKKMSEIKVVIAGAGSAGYCIAKLLNFAGCKNIVVLDSDGAIHKKRKTNMNKYKLELAEFTSEEKGRLPEAIRHADVFIGVSGVKNLLKAEMIKEMSVEPVIFALTNPEPEIDPALAKRSGARIVATGSFKYENKVNNALVFPYLVRAILDLKIQRISMDILYAASMAIAGAVPKKRLSDRFIIPSINDKGIQRKITSTLKNIVR